MTEDLQDVDLSGYAVMSSDGAYVHYNEGIVRVMFYRDFAFPTHGANESVVFDKKKREIVQEIRLSKVAATQVCGDLKNILHIARAFDPIARLTMEATHEGHKDQFDAQFKMAWAKYDQVMHPILDMLMQTTEQGQDKIMAIFENFIEIKKPKLKEIVDEFPFKMRDFDGQETKHTKL